jgi:glycine/D-amino acid oxidase-like deaminating enzyme
MSIPAERLGIESAEGLYPSFRGDDLAFVLLEPEGGLLRAQRAVRALAAQAALNGAQIVRGRARPEGAAAIREDSTRLEGDVVVWACGPWLGRLFPDLISLSVTRQELLFFDGGPAWRAPGLPSWCDYDRARYGTADIDGLGVKAAIDDLGPPLDPEAELTDEVTTEPQVRAYVRDRFPRSSALRSLRPVRRATRSRPTRASSRPRTLNTRVSGSWRRLGPRIQARPADGPSGSRARFGRARLFRPTSRSGSDSRRGACARQVPAPARKAR